MSHCSANQKNVATVQELESVTCMNKKQKDDNDDPTTEENKTLMIRVFSLSLNGVVVQVCSLGASITQFCVPKKRSDADVVSEDDDDEPYGYDDIVLGYASPLDMWKDGNPAYLGAIVGRVANRIAKGQFQLPTDNSDNEDEEVEHFQLETNNGPNHLHGGSGGFSHRIWQAEIIEEKTTTHQDDDDLSTIQRAVKFSLLSEDGDQGYPGSVRVTATYSLCNGSSWTDGTPAEEEEASSSSSVRLCLDMQAHLVVSNNNDDDNSIQVKATPINLAQHSYFNLAGHDHKAGILNHRLQLPHSPAYLPVTVHSIPTREVRPVSQNTAMDWCTQSRLLQLALAAYGVEQMGLSRDEAMANVTKRSRILPDIATATVAFPKEDNEDSTAATFDEEEVPYGFDHNYVVEPNLATTDSPATATATTTTTTTPASAAEQPSSPLTRVAVLEHRPSHRRLTVYSNAPGVQLYTANYLDGTVPNHVQHLSKHGARYRQWQALCLETQHYPDSIHVVVNRQAEHHEEEFAKGACPILTAKNPVYRHCVEYELEYNIHNTGGDDDLIVAATTTFRGRDSQGRHYESVEAMWQEQRAGWYDRAAAYYQENCEATVEGVLGGFGAISDVDLAGSRQFLEEVLVLRPLLQQKLLANRNSGASAAASDTVLACECGAGIGRVSKGLLFPAGATRCDLIESSARLLHAAPDYLGDDDLADRCRYYCSSLQDWHPPTGRKYDIIWIQWVLIYLTDDDAIAFLQRCGDALVEDGGIIILKENTVSAAAEGDDDYDDFEVDVEDASVTRSVAYWKHLCAAAGLSIVHEKTQDNFPNEIYPVPMIALQKKKK